MPNNNFCAYTRKFCTYYCLRDISFRKNVNLEFFLYMHINIMRNFKFDTYLSFFYRCRRTNRKTN